METDLKPTAQEEVLDKHPLAVSIDEEGLLKGIEDRFIIPVDKKRHLRELPGCGVHCTLQGQFMVETVNPSQQLDSIMLWMEFNGKKDQESHPAARVKVGEWVPLKDVHLNKFTSNKIDIMAFSPMPSGCTEIRLNLKAKLV